MGKTEDGENKSKEWGIKFLETSAKTKHNVDEMVHTCIREVREIKRKNFVHSCRHLFKKYVLRDQVKNMFLVTRSNVLEFFFPHLLKPHFGILWVLLKHHFWIF